ncbi:hypothetical protein M409DRAFT_22652 [Zasmidium cellare ATCC 36951]|uniref:Uncharacterized protein n=1 Tax=Zasmidium cellare ATCC 36951 TaxID=1080233 RepID=A0A6A6CJ14_ZASCE|nr:uncharacterized protein M409DRAFT_22652 [Zasmidium cellare ATCC 36951]KAF2167224.1 hypothetical protein M409DRAFT_22652 [Zasmidium cellare ATCC 36951]
MTSHDWRAIRDSNKAIIDLRVTTIRSKTPAATSAAQGEKKPEAEKAKNQPSPTIVQSDGDNKDKYDPKGLHELRKLYDERDLGSEGDAEQLRWRLPVVVAPAKIRL